VTTYVYDVANKLPQRDFFRPNLATVVPNLYHTDDNLSWQDNQSLR